MEQNTPEQKFTLDKVKKPYLIAIIVVLVIIFAAIVHRCTSPANATSEAIRAYGSAMQSLGDAAMKMQAIDSRNGNRSSSAAQDARDFKEAMNAYGEAMQSLGNMAEKMEEIDNRSGRSSSAAQDARDFKEAMNAYGEAMQSLGNMMDKLNR